MEAPAQTQDTRCCPLLPMFSELSIIFIFFLELALENIKITHIYVLPCGV